MKLTYAGMKRAEKIIREEPTYIHTSFQSFRDSSNCYCALGAVATVHGCDRGWAVVTAILQHKKYSQSKLGQTLDRLSDAQANVTRRQAINALVKIRKTLFGR